MNTLLTKVLSDTTAHRGFQNMLKTDGISQYGTFPSAQWNGQPIANFFNTDKAFTFAFWFKKTSNAQTCYFNFESPANQSTNGDYFITLLPATGGWVVISNYSSTANQETHIAGSYDGNSQFKMWINSIPQAISITGAKIAPVSYTNVYFNRGGGNASWESAMADYRFFDNQLLTDSEIRNLYNYGWEYDIGGRAELVRLPMTLTSHFDSNTPVGKCRALDISGNNNHLILENMGTTPNLVAF